VSRNLGVRFFKDGLANYYFGIWFVARYQTSESCLPNSWTRQIVILLAGSVLYGFNYNYGPRCSLVLQLAALMYSQPSKTVQPTYSRNMYIFNCKSLKSVQTIRNNQ
jgi:hypothetical protein